MISKIKVYKSPYLIFIFGLEIWSLTQRQESTIQAAKIKYSKGCYQNGQVENIRNKIHLEGEWQK